MKITVHSDAVRRKPGRAVDIGDMGRKKVGVFVSAQARGQLVLLLDEDMPIPRFSSPFASREADDCPAVVQRLDGSHEDLRRDAADVDAGAAECAMADRHDLGTKLARRLAPSVTFLPTSTD